MSPSRCGPGRQPRAHVINGRSIVGLTVRSIYMDAMESTMPFVPFITTCQVELVFAYEGQICENVYHVHQTGDWDEAALNTIADTFITWWKANFPALSTQNMKLTKVKARDLTAETATGIEAPVTTGNVGTLTDQPMPTGTALAIKWSSGLTGRSFRGRTYHMGMTVSSMFTGNSNFVSNAYLASLVTAYGALLTAVNVADQSLVIASRVAGGLPRALGAATPIIAVSIDQNTDSQRRRLNGRGM